MRGAEPEGSLIRPMVSPACPAEGAVLGEGLYTPCNRRLPYACPCAFAQPLRPLSDLAPGGCTLPCMHASCCIAHTASTHRLPQAVAFNPSSWLFSCTRSAAVQLCVGPQHRLARKPNASLMPVMPPSLALCLSRHDVTSLPRQPQLLVLRTFRAVTWTFRWWLCWSQNSNMSDNQTECSRTA